MRPLDLIGRRFGRLSVVARSDNDRKNQSRWKCVCDCGNESIKYGYMLTAGRAISCGCAKSEKVSAARTIHGHKKRSNESHEYVCWYSMIQRCTYKKSNRYAKYGARGVQVHPTWRDFSTFLRDVGPSPSPNHSLDRFPNRNGNYEPGNVRWATRHEQANNKDNNVLLTARGETKTIAEWSAVSGIKYATIRARHCKGWNDEDAIFAPLLNRIAP